MTGRARRLAIAVAVGLVLLLGWSPLAGALTPPRTAESALASLTAADLAEPDTVALALRASARMGDRARVKEYAARLDRLAIRHGDQIGWGLSAAWDAYADGTVNPRNTVYTYTTAVAGLALLDAYGATGEQRFLEEATRAADTILARACCANGRTAVWYSDQPVDQMPGLVAPNVSGISAALLLRLPERRFQQAGNRLIDGLLADRRGMNWLYRDGAARRNDLIHLTFIIEGLARSPRTRALAARVADAALARHFDGTTPHDDSATLGSQGWGPPALLAVMRDLRRPSAGALAKQLAGDAAPWPDLLKESPRGRAWYAYGLAQ